MIDVHSHVLWGIDDGPATLEESLAMLRFAAECGTTDVIATPHWNAKYVFERAIVDQRIAEVNAMLEGNPRVYRGCEFHLTFDNLQRIEQDPYFCSLNGGPYLLVEFPDFHIGRHMETVLQSLLDRGIVPVVAHPECNPVLQQDIDRVGAWVDLGCLMQVTSSSITGAFGDTPRSASAKLLDRGLVHAVASDTHDLARRPPRLDEACRILQSRYGEEQAKLLCTENPGNFLKGQPLMDARLTHGERPKRWWRF